MTCNEPSTTTDPRGNVTNYTYDSTHGGVLTVTSPAPVTGAVRPQTRYGYTALQAYYKNSVGSIVASGHPTYLLTSTSECQTLSTCAGAADEVKTSIGYGPQATGTPNNLLPVSISRGSGDGTLTATEAYTYDNVGNVTFVDGPLPGTADTTRALYDVGRQVIGQISPDPDGSGTLPNRAIRLTYNLDGQVTKVERGTTAGQTDTAWSNFSQLEFVDSVYDSSGRKTTDTLKSGSTAYTLIQYSYDSVGRLSCVAQRMNPAVYGSLPSSACALSTQGSFGPDPISQNVYDAAGEVTQLQEGVGTADAANERTLGYNPNGTVASLTDGENNKTTYLYDGFDRLFETQYPSVTKGAGTSDPSDFEQLTYDANGNVVSRRLRDAQVIGFSYDALDRLTFKDLPGSEPDVTYAYDNLGRVTSLSQPDYPMTFGYDALGRQTSENEAFGAFNRQYDLAGRLIQLTWWDGFFVSYDHLVTGEVSAVRENGATSGVGVLASYTYDALGNRTGATFGNGTIGSYAYDPVSRLSSLSHDAAGTTFDLTKTFAYNPASQIVSQTSSNDAYAWTGAVDINRPYASNGLNQYISAGPASFTYDANGNLTSDGTNTFAYDSQDRLTSSTLGGVTATLTYDPLGHLTGINATTQPRLVYDGDQLEAETDTSKAILHRYVFGPGLDEPLVDYNGPTTSNRLFLDGDERGSVIAISDTAGNGHIDAYDEYGVPASANTERFGYTGQMWLPEVELYDYKNRIYSPTLGRFLQTDPIGPTDSPNLYQYVLNDPVNLTDPLGLEVGPPDPVNLTDPLGLEVGPPDPSGLPIYVTCNCGYENAPIEARFIATPTAQGLSFTLDEIIIKAPRRTPRNHSGRVNVCLAGATAAGASRALNYTGWAHKGFETIAQLGGGGKAAHRALGPIGNFIEIAQAITTFTSSAQNREPLDVAAVRAVAPLLGGFAGTYGGSALGVLAGGLVGGAGGEGVGALPGAAVGGVAGGVIGSVVGEKGGEIAGQEYAILRGYGACH